MLQSDSFDEQFYLFRINISLQNIPQTIDNFRQTARFLFQLHFTAFNTAHIQNVIDQAQQMISGRHDLFQILFYLIPVIDMGDRQRSKPYDCIHRGTDIMGHIGKKYALCLIRLICLQKRFLQHTFFLHFITGFLIHAAESNYDPLTFLPCSGAHCFHLEILYLIIPE